jgi:hypothetical protein
MSDLVEMFKAATPATRRVLLATMDCNNPELRDLHSVPTELHETLAKIQGDDVD